MNKDARIREIAKIKSQAEGEASKTHERIRWRGQIESMVVCSIPLKLLVYNKYNGRILSRTKSLDRQGKPIDPETDEGKEIIEKLLWESKESRNQITMKDLKGKQQLKVGIITKDGVIIDGNRRAMLLNKLGKRYFLAVVLPARQDDDPLEIRKLETEYQMGEDKKLDYNPIEKYLRAGELYDALRVNNSPERAIADIAQWMGEQESKVREYLDVLKTIDDYLKYLEYDGIYAMADVRDEKKEDAKEDLFIKLTYWIKAFEGEKSNKAFDGYRSHDVSLLKQVSFDYIRAKIGASYDGKKFRNIAEGRKESHFFGNEKIWKSFLDSHKKNIFPIRQKIDREMPVQSDDENIERYLSTRDIQFRNDALELLVDNIENHVTDLGYNRAANQPLKLVRNAKKALDAINTSHAASNKPDVMQEMQEINKMTQKMLGEKSPDKALSLIIEMLNELNDNGFNGGFNKDAIIEKVIEINKISFKIKKKLGM